MKLITNKTLLKQGTEIYQPIEVDDVIYWVAESLPKDREICVTFHRNTGEPLVTKDGVFYEEDLSYYVHQPKKIIAQSKLAAGWKTNPFPIINLDNLKSIEPQYTQADIEKAIDLAHIWSLPKSAIIHQLNSISLIEVDEHFNIIKYES